MKALNNKVAIVTSATRGIGLACALKLAREGATVYMGVRRLDATQEICDNYADLNMKPVFFDAFNVDSYKAMVDEVIQKEGKIDILVNNYGTGNPEKDHDLINTDEESFFRLLELNVGSVFRISKLVIPYMIENNITQQIAMEYAKYNIRCNAVLPGMTATDAVSRSMDEQFQKSFLSHVPLNRMGTPEDIANAVFFFASENSSYITGSILEVSGGYHLGTPQYADYVGRKMQE